MKTLLSIFALAAFTTAGFGQMSVAKVNSAQNILGAKNIGPVPTESLVAHGIVDANGNVVVSGKVGGSQAALTAASTISFAPSNGIMTYTLTPAQAETINAVTVNAVQGATYKLIITTSGTSSYTITFGTAFTTIGTLETGTTTAIVYALDFVYDGTAFREVGRKRLSSTAIVVPYTVTTSTLPYAEGVSLYNFTPTTSENLAFSVAGRAGAVVYLHIIGDASAARTTTFTTNAKPNGTLATGSSGSTDSFATFISDGTNWREVSSATGQTP